MNILGISAFYHDAAAALICDGEIAAAAQEERFTRRKHDAAFPVHAIRSCLDQRGIDLSQVDYIAFYEKPLLKFERLLETSLAFAPAGFANFRKAMPIWLKEKLFLPRMMRTGLKELPGHYDKPFVFTRHHESHAASAFFPSPFDEAAIITADGVGEWTTTSIGKGDRNRIKLLCEQRFPHSLGLLYSAFTCYTGFRVNSGEYKLMGLAPYGEPKYSGLIEDRLIDIQEDGAFRMNMRYFNYCQGLTMTNRRFERLFGHPARAPEGELQEFHMDIAASIQKVAEKVMLRTAAHAREVAGSNSLCLAGGVALNCVANGRILRDGPFANIWIQPAAGDAGGAVGAAWFVWHQLLEMPRETGTPDRQRGSLLGPGFSNEEIEGFLRSRRADYSVVESDQELCRKVAGLIAEQSIVGWFQGRMEFGPRALGSRSILGDARSATMQAVMNRKIKFRESFRPFAPSVLRERADEFFDLRPGEDSPYMLLVAEVAERQRTGDRDVLKAAHGLDKLDVPRSEIQAVTHVDGTARVQTVDRERNPLFYGLLREFETLTGCPVVVNTSFNVRGEPVVCTPEEAYRVFQCTGMDALVLGHCVLLKENQPRTPQADSREHLARFDPD